MLYPSHPPLSSISYIGKDRASEVLLEPMLKDIGYEGKRLLSIARSYALRYLGDHTGCTMGEWAHAVDCYSKGYADALCDDSVLEQLPGVARLLGWDRSNSIRGRQNEHERGNGN